MTLSSVWEHYTVPLALLDFVIDHTFPNNNTTIILIITGNIVMFVTTRKDPGIFYVIDWLLTYKQEYLTHREFIQILNKIDSNILELTDSTSNISSRISAFQQKQRTSQPHCLPILNKIMIPIFHYIIQHLISISLFSRTESLKFFCYIQLTI